MPKFCQKLMACQKEAINCRYLPKQSQNICYLGGGDTDGNVTDRAELGPKKGPGTFIQLCLHFGPNSERCWPTRKCPVWHIPSPALATGGWPMLTLAVMLIGLFMTMPELFTGSIVGDAKYDGNVS